MYKLFETNSTTKNNRHHKTLVFLCTNNHFYPIEKEEDRQTIFKIFASSVGGVKQINMIKKEDEEEETDLSIIITCKEINEVV